MSVSAAPAARRVSVTEQRRARVDAGLEELERWLADQVRVGLAGLPKLGHRHFESVAARMVDAQAPGVAGMLRSIPAEFGATDWPDRMLHELAGLHLLCRAHARLDDLPPALAATVRSRVGYPTAKADVLATTGTADTWWALGGVETNDQQLRRRRVWLRGTRSGITGLQLSFAPPGMPFDDSVLPGMAVTGVLHRYPGAGQPRVLLGETSAGTPDPLRWRGESVADTRVRFAGLVAADPWASRMAAAVEGVPERDEEGGWWLRDASGDRCRLTDPAGGDLPGQPWPLVAQSAGTPLSLFGEWTSTGFAPLSVLPDDRGRLFSTEICG